MKAMITVKGTQTVEGDSNVTELTSEGTFKIENGYPVMTYDESDMTGAKVSAKLSMLDDNAFEFERRGDISTKMIIEKGVRHNCSYSTPYGDLTMGICGKSLEKDITENGGRIKMSYTIDLNSALLSENEIEITIKPLE